MKITDRNNRSIAKRETDSDGQRYRKRQGGAAGGFAVLRKTFARLILFSRNKFVCDNFSPVFAVSNEMFRLRSQKTIGRKTDRNGESTIETLAVICQFATRRDVSNASCRFRKRRRAWRSAVSEMTAINAADRSSSRVSKPNETY